MWLGVEFQHVDRPLMELKGLLDATREGRIGLIVVHVYRTSPAAALGIAPGDVLLRVIEEGTDRPVEFVNRRSWRRGYGMAGLTWNGADGGEPEPYRL